MPVFISNDKSSDKILKEWYKFSAKINSLLFKNVCYTKSAAFSFREIARVFRVLFLILFIGLLVWGGVYGTQGFSGKWILYALLGLGTFVAVLEFSAKGMIGVSEKYKTRLSGIVLIGTIGLIDLVLFSLVFWLIGYLILK
jgi:hypothetical protein